MDTIFWLATFCSLYCTILAQDILTDINQDRTVDSYYCLIGRFCYKDNAVKALTSLRSLTVPQARSLVDLYFEGSNTTAPQPRSCDCSRNCHIKNECCTDAGIPIAESSETKYTNVQCSNTGRSRVYSINSCPAEYKVEPIIKLCEQDHELFVSSKRTEITYKNVYCGLCNGEIKPNLLGWTYNYDCFTRNLVDNITDATNMTFSELTSEAKCFKISNEAMTPPAEMRDAVLRQYSTFKSFGDPCDNRFIQTCPSGTPDDLKEHCEMGGANLLRSLTDDTIVYRNQACAQCNNISSDVLACELCKTSCSLSPDRESTLFKTSFTIFLEPFSNRQTICSAEDSRSCPSSISSIHGCPETEYLDFKTLTCVNICPYPTIYKDNTCKPVNEKTIIIVEPDREKELTCAHEVSYSDYLKIYSASTGVRSVMHNGVFYMTSPSRRSNVTCHRCLRSMLVEENRVTKNNKSISLDGEEYNLAFAVLHEDDKKYRVCEPDQSTVVKDYDRSQRQTLMEILTLVLCLLSVLCLILFFIAFFIIKRMRNLPGCIIAGMMLMFLFAYISFLSRYLLDDTPSSKIACYAVSVLINYFFLAAFIFTISYSVMILQSLEFMELDSECLCTTVTKYWSPGVIVPAVMVTVGILLDKYYPTNSIAPSYGGENCFLGGSSSFALNSLKANKTNLHSSNHVWGMVTFFTGPIALCLTVNLAIYVAIICKLRNIAAATRQVRASHKEKVFLCFKLIAVMGLNWLPMIVACGYPDSFFAQLFFMIPSCLHGVFGFLVFIVTGTNLRTLRSKVSSNSKQPTSSTLSGSTSNYTSNTTATELPTLKRNRSPRPTPPTSLHNSPHLIDRKISDSVTDAESGTDSPMSNVPLRPKCDFF